MRSAMLLAGVALLARRSAAQADGVPAACSVADVGWLAAMSSCSGDACAEAAASLTSSCAAAIECEAPDLLELVGAHACLLSADNATTRGAVEAACLASAQISPICVACVAISGRPVGFNCATPPATCSASLANASGGADCCGCRPGSTDLSPCVPACASISAECLAIKQCPGVCAPLPDRATQNLNAMHSCSGGENPSRKYTRTPTTARPRDIPERLLALPGVAVEGVGVAFCNHTASPVRPTCCDADGSCSDGDADWCFDGVFYCSSNSAADAAAKGGVFCPSGFMEKDACSALHPLDGNTTVLPRACVGTADAIPATCSGSATTEPATCIGTNDGVATCTGTQSTDTGKQYTTSFRHSFEA